MNMWESAGIALALGGLTSAVIYSNRRRTPPPIQKIDPTKEVHPSTLWSLMTQQPNLTHLDLHSNSGAGLSLLAFEWIGKFKQLQTLDALGRQWSGRHFEQLARHVPQLKGLEFSGNEGTHRLSAEDFAPLARSNLTHLNFDGRIPAGAEVHIAKMPHLEQLRIKRGVTNGMMQMFSKMPKLTHLTVNMTRRSDGTTITDAGIAHFRDKEVTVKYGGTNPITPANPAG